MSPWSASLKMKLQVIGRVEFSAAKRKFTLALLTFALFLFAFRQFFGTGMLAYGDEPPFPQTAQQAFDVFFSSWHPMSLGITAQYPLNSFLVGLTILVTGGNAVLAQKVWFFFPMPLSFLSMYFFSRRFTESTFGRWLSSFVYSVNPVTIGTPYIGGAVGTLFLYAFLPLLLGILISLFTSSQHSPRNFLAFTLLFTLSGGLLTAVYILPFFLALLIFVLAQRKIKLALTRLALLAGSIALFVGLTLPGNYAGLPVFARYLPSSLNSSSPPIPISDLVGGISYTYSQQTILNLLNFGVTALPFPGYFSGTSWWTALGFLYPMLAFSALFFIRKSSNAIFIAGFSAYSLAVLFFIWVTKLGPGIGVFATFPFLFTFSNPSGLDLMIMVGYAPLIAIALDRILRQLHPWTLSITNVHKARRVTTISTVFALLLLLLAGSYVWPFFTGNMGFGSIGVPVDKLSIPAVYYQASDWLNLHIADNDPSRTLWVPLDYQAQLDLRWLDSSAVTFPLGIGQYLTLPITRYVGFAFTALANNDTSNVGALLAPLNVKYIILNLASSQTGTPSATGFLNYGEPFLFGSPLLYQNILNSQKDLRLIENESSFLVYLNMDYQHRVQPFGKLYYVTSLGAHDNVASDTESVGFLSSFPRYSSATQILALESASSPDQRSWLNTSSDAQVINVASGVAKSQSAYLAKPIFEIDQTNPSPGSWSPTTGQWVVRGDGLSGISPDMPSTWSYADLLYENLNISDFSFGTYFNIVSPVADSFSQQPGIFLRHSKEGFYLVEVEPDANRIAVYRSDLSTPVATAPLHVQPNAWYNLTAAISGQAGAVHLSVYMNATLSVDTTDLNTPNPVVAGYVGLQSKGYHTSVIEFKNTRIATPNNRELYSSAIPSPYTVANAQILVPKDGNYTLYAYAPGPGQVTFALPNTTINASRIIGNWVDSGSVLLSHGTYDVTISYGNRTVLESNFLQTHLALVSSTFDSLRYSNSDSPYNLVFQDVSSTSYELTLETQGPVQIQLSEMFSTGWTALVDGIKAIHYVSDSFLNGFYVNSAGSHRIVIQYEGQNLKNRTIMVWIGSWLLLLLSSFLLVSQRRLRTFFSRSLLAK